MRDVHLVLILS